MNPFDWRGPQFLLFYLLLGSALLALLALRRRYFEPRPPVKERLTDPFAIAYLRAGAKEVLRLAVLSLIERDMLEANGPKLETKPARDRAGLPPLERRILEKFEDQSEASAVFRDPVLEGECKRLRESLESGGLVPDAGQRTLRWWSTLSVIAVLVIVALVKIQVALARGRTNVLFLVVLAIAFCAGALLLTKPRRTPRGTAVLEDLQQLLGLALRRSRESSSRAELALLAAAFGVAATGSIHATRAKQVFPKGTSPSSSCGSSGCGWASWGGSSSCGSSGGSSCGGGGCGGGCGGCGS